MHKLSVSEQFIIGQALVDIKTEKDIPIVREKVLCTVVGINDESVKMFDHLVEQKIKAGLIKGESKSDKIFNKGMPKGRILEIYGDSKIR